MKRYLIIGGAILLCLTQTSCIYLLESALGNEDSCLRCAVYKYNDEETYNWETGEYEQPTYWSDWNCQPGNNWLENRCDNRADEMGEEYYCSCSSYTDTDDDDYCEAEP